MPLEQTKQDADYQTACKVHRKCGKRKCRLEVLRYKYRSQVTENTSDTAANAD